MKKIKFIIVSLFLSMAPICKARADFWGGDLIYLAQILEQTITEVQTLQSVLGTGKDTLDYLKNINKGLHDTIQIINTANRVLKPGTFSNLNNINELISEVESLYGKIPQTSEAKLQSTNDLSVVESIELHNEAFKYADQVDPEAERLKQYANEASPQGAAKASLQAQSIQVHVLNQILRTQAALLKIQSQQFAMQNRKSKLQSEQFRSQYNEIAKTLHDDKPGFDLPSLNSN